MEDSLFEKYAEEQQKEAEERSSKSSGNSNFTFEVVKWAGLETNNIKIVRAYGGPPNSAVDEFTAKTVRVSWIIGDDGTKFRCILPEAADAPDHILWNIIARVKRADWVDGVKTIPVADQHPEIFNIVNKNGLDSKDRSFIFDKGWTGRNVLLMNVLDREQMDWHRENKHTVLLSRNIGVSKDGKEFPEIGVPSYGFSGALGNLFKFYGSWEKYDIGITRTGLKEAPYRVINASKYLEETGEKSSLVSADALTDEERAYEQYDLAKLFQFTKFTKIYNHLKGRIAKIDAVLDTNFLTELKFLVDKEKEERAEQKTMENREQNIGSETEVKKAPVVRQRATVAKSAPDETKFDTLPGWNALSSDEQNAIESVDIVNGSAVITYKDKDAILLACPECNSPGPESFTACASCGLVF